VNEGFAFESQNNQINLGEGFAKASLSGKVMPGHQSSFASLVKMAPSLVEYQANVEYDKQIMKTLMSNYMQQGGKTLSDQELEQMLNGMQQAVQAKREGDVLKIGIEYKYGEKKFLN
jgi:cyclophilin family peptidyl-prolyl cis-trans isomerase